MAARALKPVEPVKRVITRSGGAKATLKAAGLCWQHPCSLRALAPFPKCWCFEVLKQQALGIYIFCPQHPAIVRHDEQLSILRSQIAGAQPDIFMHCDIQRRNKNERRRGCGSGSYRLGACICDMSVHCSQRARPRVFACKHSSC